jgi:peptidoglycan/LPS O-acetylase OafA/YrhL
MTPERQPRAPGTRLVGLDLLRLLAVVLVLGRHMPGPAPEHWPTALRTALTAWQTGGWIGVDLFFVLSGFLVAGLLFAGHRAHGRVAVVRFYVRRSWKIYPPFFALLAVTLVVRALAGQPLPAAAIAAEAFFLQSYVPGLWHHTWSLAVEEHFYQLLPPALLFVLWRGRTGPQPMRGILPLAAAAAGLCLALRVVTWQTHPWYEHRTHLFASHLRLDALLFGVAIAYLRHYHAEWFVRRLTPWRGVLGVGGAALLLPAFVTPIETTPWLHTVGLTVVYVGSGMLLVGCLLAPAPAAAWTRALAGLGARSYSIYLWHLPVLAWIVPLFAALAGEPPGHGVVLTVYLGGALAVGVAMARCIEEPALRLRDRWFPSRTPGPIDGSSAANATPAVGAPTLTA